MDSAELSVPDVALSGLEVPYYEAYYRSVDPFNLGFVDSESCAKLLRRTGLNMGTIAKILTLSDFKKNQIYDKKAFFFLLKLVNEEQQRSSVVIPGTKLPFGVPKLKPMVDMKGPDGPFQMTHFDKERYLRFFRRIFEHGSAQNAGPFNEHTSLVSGKDVYPFFTATGLPRKPTLSDVWSLADKYARGALNFMEFCLALKLLEAVMNGVKLPTEIPASLKEENIFRFEQEAAGSMAVHYMQAESKEQKAYITLFKQLDSDHDGFVTGKECVGVFSMSKLSRKALAEIWDSADPMKTGKLDIDRFCHAMKQIERAKAGGDVAEYTPSLGSVILHEKNLDVASMAADEIKQEIGAFKAKVDEMQPKILYKEKEVERLLLDLERLKHELEGTVRLQASAQAECEESKKESDVLMEQLKRTNEQIHELQQKIKIEVQYQENMKAQHEKYVKDFVPQRQRAQQLVEDQESLAGKIIQERQVQEEVEKKVSDLENRVRMAKTKNHELTVEIKTLQEAIKLKKDNFNKSTEWQ